jgi:hypothetical protein
MRKEPKAELKNCTILHNGDDFSSSPGRAGGSGEECERKPKPSVNPPESTRCKRAMQCCSNPFSEQPTTLPLFEIDCRDIGSNGTKPCAGRSSSGRQDATDRDTQSLLMDSPLRKSDGCSHLNIVAEHGDSALGRMPTLWYPACSCGTGHHAGAGIPVIQR